MSLLIANASSKLLICKNVQFVLRREVNTATMYWAWRLRSERSKGSDPVGLWHTCLLQTNLLWILWTLISFFFFLWTSKGNPFYTELSYQNSFGTSSSTKLPSIVRGISTCIIFHMSICRVKMCEAPCSLESSIRKLK